MSTLGLTFGQQVDRLIELGYPALAGLAEDDFRTRLAPLAPLADQFADQVADQVEGARAGSRSFWW